MDLDNTSESQTYNEVEDSVTLPIYQDLDHDPLIIVEEEDEVDDDGEPIPGCLKCSDPKCYRNLQA